MSSAPVMTASDWLSAYQPPRSLTLDQEALRVYQRAYFIGAGDAIEDPADPPISFTVLLAALLEGEDESSRWFADRAARLGPHRDRVLAAKGITDEILRAADSEAARLAPDQPPSNPRLSSDQHLLTSSSRAVLEGAENWAQRVGGSDIGVRHLIASYVLNPPPYHRKQLKDWGFNENQWRSEFFAWVSRRFTWEHWIDASQRAAPIATRVAYEQQQVKGKTLAWPGHELSWTILNRAAARHHTADGSLGFLTVFFSFIEQARENTAIGNLVPPLLSAVANAGDTFRGAEEKYFVSTSSDDARQPFGELDISARVLNALETARDLAATARVRNIDSDGRALASPLHLAGALVSRRVDADDELSTLGLNLLELRNALVDHVASSHDESIEAWRELLGVQDLILSGRPVDLNSDEPEAVVRLDEKWVDDPLAIRPDVESFASLLASRDLEPPLSIGLFGPWGSGKTTFLKRLRRSVQRHADDAKTDAAARQSYVPNVVHVEFNAWHFSEDALVSSLVDTTIRRIADYVRDRPDLGPQDWLDRKLSELESRQRQVAAATERQNAADAAVVAAQKQVNTSEDEAKKRASSLKHAVRRVWSATTAALASDTAVQKSGVLQAFGDTVQDVDDLRNRVQALRARPGRILGDLGWGHSGFFAALVLIVPPAIAWLVGRLGYATDAEKLMSALAALVTVVGVWAKVASTAVSQVDNAVSRVVNEYERQITSDAAVVKAQTELETARAAAQTAAAGLQAARMELARAQTEAANASLPAQTLQLATTRIEDRSYAKELTTLSLARADLDALSRILLQQRSETGGTANGDLRAVDRVILYIDDLDRCKPEDVVRVLQVVHMLLAFELFVVVVAVDARWVEQALRASYPWLSDGGSPSAQKNTARNELSVEPFDYVTPEDYLEKIFQISFWLEPMTAGRAASYLTTLIRPRATSNGRSAVPATTTGPSPAKVDVSSEELDYMRALAAYVGSSPRRVKRLVNAYRLIKARLSDAQLNGFVTERGSNGARARTGPYQIVIGLLVIGTGAQSSSSRILGELGELDPKETYGGVVEAFTRRGEPDWHAAARVIQTMMRQQNESVLELRGWARQVGRFLLHGPIADLKPRPVPAPAAK